MSEYKSKIALGVVVSVIVASAFIGALYYLPQSTNTTTAKQTSLQTTLTQSTSFPDYASSTNSSSGLNLELSMNATTMSQGDTINLNVSLYNTLSKVNNVSAGNDWPISGLNLGPCPLAYPFGFAVFQGYYSSSNVSGAHALSLSDPTAVHTCPAFPYVSFYLFQGTSYNGSIYVQSSNGTQQCCEERPGQPFPMTGSLHVNTYWDNESIEHNLSPGVYTVVGGDEWADMLVLHFVVSTVSAGPPGVASVTNSSLGLKLGLSMNSTIYYLYENVSVNIIESNILPKMNNLTASSTDWPAPGLAIGPCGTMGSPVGIAIFQGYYTASNISSAHPLQIYAPGTYFCPGSSENIASYEFQPSSDSGLVCSDYPSSCLKFSSSYEVTSGGYWFNPTMDNVNLVFTGFGSGTYTIAGGDEWGDLVLLHFIVKIQ